MIHRQIYNRINNQLIINLPDDFKIKKQVLVIINDTIDYRVEKLALLKKVSTDPLYLSDINNIRNDFYAIDNCRGFN